MDKPKPTKRKGYRVISNIELHKMYDATHESIDWMKEHDLIDVKSVLLGQIKKFGKYIIKPMEETKTQKLSDYNKKRLHNGIIETAERIIKAAEFLERIDTRLDEC